jgi:adenine deaminase
LLAKAGVSVIFSSFDVHRTKTLRQAAGNAVRGGMKHSDALRAITTAPAEAFEMGEHGVIAKGKKANLVVWSGDPLELSSQAETIIVHGRVVPNRSRQTELLKKYRTLERRADPAPAPESFRPTATPSHRGDGPPVADPPMVQ